MTFSENMRARWFGLGLAAFVPVLVFACGLDDSIALQGGPGAVDGGALDGTLTSTDGAALDGSTPNDSSSGPDGTAPPPILVYANTQTELFSYEVVSNMLTDIGPLTGCGTPPLFNDLAIDSTGQMYLLQQGSGIYKLDITGHCTDASPLNMDPTTIDKISGRNNGSPVIVAVNGTNDDFYGIDMSTAGTGNTTKINPDLFTDPPGALGLYDLACGVEGTCWAALNNQECGGGATSSCLYSFPDDGGVVGRSLGVIGVHPAGLALANRILYTFDDDGQMSKIPVFDGAGVLATTFTPNLAGTTKVPLAWLGAASSSTNQ